MNSIEEKIISTSNIDIEDLFKENHTAYSFVNPVSYLALNKRSDLVDKLDGLFVDGGVLCRFIRIFYGEKISRTSFDLTSFAPILLQHCIEQKKTLYIVGSKQDEIEVAVTELKKRFHGLNLIGFRNGYLTGPEISESIESISDSSPDYLICGMGIIKQEEFILALKENGFNGVSFTCGGFLHQIASGGYEAYYPKYIDKLNLRFAYRFFKEPHTRKRYLVSVIKFPIIFSINYLRK